MTTTASDFLSRGGVSLAAIGDALPNVDSDRVLVRPVPWWLRILWRPWVQGMATSSKIYIRAHRLAHPERSTSLVVHELVHIAQWRRLGRLRFGTRYVREAISGLIRFRNSRKAHDNISFEIEADLITDQILQRPGPR
ncbi:MAG: hypothetical protein OEM22_06070 [Acidimicrobiia bacterium]|nr:hypothetical protein [Acidimicrobiia bacterium]MDH3471361.1 hypothetical protein [Acidimicrobiia bacterium]